MTEPAVAVGVDVGGSKLVLGIVHDNGEISHENRIPTEQRHPEWVTEQIVAYAKECGPRLPVGVAAAGTPDRDGVLHFGAFIPWNGFPLRAQLAHQLDVPVFVQNDVTVAAWGEYLLDPERRSVAVLAAGTGVGGGAVSDGALLIGRGAAMEIGHLPVSNSTALCGCGKFGCLETVASGSAVASRYHQRRRHAMLDNATEPPPPATAIVAAADAGDDDAKAVLREAGEALGEAAALIALVLDPERIILTGGLMQGAAHLILDSARSSFNGRVPLPNRRSNILQKSVARIDPIVLGAGCLAADLAAGVTTTHIRRVDTGAIGNYLQTRGSEHADAERFI